MGTEHESRTLSAAAKVWITVVGVLLMMWFLFAWLILDRHVMDAAGESVGTAFALAVIVSVVGSIKQSR
jgi:hypothetical protein